MSKQLSEQPSENETKEVANSEPTTASASPEEQQALDAVMQALEEDDSLTEDGGTGLSGGIVGIGMPVNTNANEATSEVTMTAEEKSAAKSALIEQETTIGKKTEQNGEILTMINDVRIDAMAGMSLEQDPNGVTAKQMQELLGGNVTMNKDNGCLHYSGTLGDFDYDPNEFAIGLKKIKDVNGVSASIPVLRCIETDNSGPFSETVYGGGLTIPDGVKSLDYTFEGMDNLETVPVIPDSVESAHCAFKGCVALERACDDAKVDEYDCTGDVANGTLTMAGTTATGAAIGSVVPVLGTGLGAGVGAIIGYFWKGNDAVDGVSNNGKGGLWRMPKNLKDASYMFSDCPNLVEAYDKASDDLMIARGMYKDNKNLGMDEFATEHGAVAVTDFKDSILSKEAVQGSYDGTNTNVGRQLEGNYSSDWDEETGTLNKAGVDAETKKEVEDLNEDLKEQDIVNGVVDTDYSMNTDGLASYGTVMTENGIVKTDNINDENVENGGLMGLLDRGVVSLGEFKILKMVTGNTLLSIAGTFGLQMLGILPKSMKPILTTVADFAGKDSMIGGALNGLADKLPDGNNTTELIQVSENDKAQKDASDKTVADIGERLSTSIGGAVDMSAEKGTDITASMTANGKAIARDNVLLTAGNKSDYDVTFKTLNDTMLVSAGAMEEKATSMAKDGEMSDENKKALASKYMTIMRGFKAYDQGARQTITSQYGDDTEKVNKASTGLQRIMKSSVAPMYDSMKELDEKYHFLSEENIKELDAMQISGVTPYSSYQFGTMYQQQAAAPQTNVEQNKEISSEDEMYANAGIDDPLPEKKSTTQVETRQSSATSKAKAFVSDRLSMLDPLMDKIQQNQSYDNELERE